MISRPATASLILLLLVTSGSAFAATLTDVTTLDGPGRYDVTLSGSDVVLGGILFRPAKADRPQPAIIALHGWAEAGVPGAPRVEGTARRLSEQGYVALALSMRGWPNSGGRDDCGLEQPKDVVKAADWLASLSGVDRGRIGVVGFSQGGQVALLAGALSKRIGAIVAYFPVTDIQRWAETTSFAAIREFYVPNVCEPGGAMRSPVNVASKIEASVLLIHGDHDTRVPTEQSRKMQEALQKANRAVELQLVAGGDHGFTPSQYAQAWKSALKFFATHLARADPQANF